MRILSTLLFVALTFYLSAQSILQDLDQSIAESFEKHYDFYPSPIYSNAENFKLNPVKRLDSLVSIAIDTGGFYSNFKFVYEYDASYNTTVINGYNSANSMTPWVNSFRQEWVYDASNKLIEYYLYNQWSPNTNAFEHVNRYVYNYNASGQLVEIVNSTSYASTQPLENRIKEVRAYTVSGGLEESIFFEWTNAQWENDRKYIKTYSNNLLVLEEAYYHINMNWVLNSKIEYSYTNTLVATIVQSDLVNGAWEEIDKVEYLYPAAKQIITLYDWKNNIWEPEIKLEKFFDSDSSKVAEVSSFWQLASQSWGYYQREQFAYDSNIPYSMLVTFLEEEDCRRQLLSSKFESQDTIGGLQILRTETTYYWTDLATNTEFVLDGNSLLAIHPNPASSFLRFDLPNPLTLATIQLYNASGQLVISQELKGNTLKLNNLPSGFYSCLVQEGENLYSGKVIVE